VLAFFVQSRDPLGARGRLPIGPAVVGSSFHRSPLCLPRLSGVGDGTDATAAPRFRPFPGAGIATESWERDQVKGARIALGHAYGARRLCRRPPAATAAEVVLRVRAGPDAIGYM
jgi:hypothetical protein